MTGICEVILVGRRYIDYRWALSSQGGEEREKEWVARSLFFRSWGGLVGTIALFLILPPFIYPTELLLSSQYPNASKQPIIHTYH